MFFAFPAAGDDREEAGGGEGGHRPVGKVFSPSGLAAVVLHLADHLDDGEGSFFDFIAEERFLIGKR